jgi:hypothetical protein
MESEEWILLRGEAHSPFAPPSGYVIQSHLPVCPTDLCRADVGPGGVGTGRRAVCHFPLARVGMGTRGSVAQSNVRVLTAASPPCQAPSQ